MTQSTVATTRRVATWLLSVLLAGATSAADVPPRTSRPLAEWPAHVPSPTFDLIDGQGHPRTPADYRGRPFVVLFGFARCPDVCPAELFKLATSLKAMGRAGKEVRVLFVTVDPDHDSPEDLHTFVSAYDPHFEALTGSAAQVHAATESFHINYAHVPQGRDYTLSHSSPVFLFDRAATLRRIGSAETPVGDYTRALSALAAEQQ